MEYGQFCPIAKATDIIGEKWSLLVILELLMGGRRFNELQRGLSLIAPSCHQICIWGIINLRPFQPNTQTNRRCIMKVSRAVSFHLQYH